MKFLQHIIFSLLISFISINAFAEDTSGTNGLWYLGGGFGKSFSRANSGYFISADGTPDPGVKSEGYGGKLFVGYLFNSNLGAEFSYMQFAPVHVGEEFGDSIKTTAMTLEAVLLCPVSKNLDFGASVGTYLPHYGVSPTIVFAGTPPKAAMGVAYGLFGQYMLEQNAYIRAGWDQLVNTGGNGNSYKPNNSLLSVSFVIGLGNT